MATTVITVLLRWSDLTTGPGLARWNAALGVLTCPVLVLAIAIIPQHPRGAAWARYLDAVVVLAVLLCVGWGFWAGAMTATQGLNPAGLSVFVVPPALLWWAMRRRGAAQITEA